MEGEPGRSYLIECPANATLQRVAKVATAEMREIMSEEER